MTVMTMLDDNNNFNYNHITSTMKRQYNGLKNTVLNEWVNKDNNYYKFYTAQIHVCIILLIAYIGNNWPKSYPRNDNHNMNLFWFMNGIIILVALYTMKHEASSEQHNTKLQVLSRSQTEEWKGLMQWMFIMYHYYRAYSVYNEIRVFVSAYVWMTGFGNFLYFDKKQDFSIERIISMWLRINYFPLLLSYFVNVPLDLFYIVPLHTTAFILTMITCYIAKKYNDYRPELTKNQCNIFAIGMCLLVHILFYETPLVNMLKVLFGNEIYFRFQADKYSAVLGIASGYGWGYCTQFINWCYNSPTTTQQHIYASYGLRVCGISLLALWYMIWGYNPDKFTYNPVHPFIFWIPVAGYLMLRNSSKYLTQVHSTALEFFGKITLETYVLQFMLFMCHNVQHIPIVIPGSGPNGNEIIKFANMLLCGTIFISTAVWARKTTVTTQTTVTDLIHVLVAYSSSSDAIAAEEKLSLTSILDDHDDNNNNSFINKPPTKSKSNISIDTADMSWSDEDEDNNNDEEVVSGGEKGDIESSSINRKSSLVHR